MAISKEQIFAVADELDAAGQNPTLANVRKQLGSGSFTRGLLVFSAISDGTKS